MDALTNCAKLEFAWFGWPKGGGGFGYGGWGGDTTQTINWNDFGKLSDELVNLKELKLQNCKLTSMTRPLGFGWASKLTKMTLYGQGLEEALKLFTQNSSQFGALESLETDRPYAIVLPAVLPLVFPKMNRVTVSMEGFDEKKALDLIATAGPDVLNPKLSIFGAHGKQTSPSLFPLPVPFFHFEASLSFFKFQLKLNICLCIVGTWGPSGQPLLTTQTIQAKLAARNKSDGAAASAASSI